MCRLKILQSFPNDWYITSFAKLPFFGIIFTTLTSKVKMLVSHISIYRTLFLQIFKQAVIGSHTDYILQQLVVTFTKPRCFPAGQSSLLFLLELAPWASPWLTGPLTLANPLAHAEHFLASAMSSASTNWLRRGLFYWSQQCLANYSFAAN